MSTGGGEAVVAAYDDLKNKIAEAGGGNSPVQTTEETPQPF